MGRLTVATPLGPVRLASAGGRLAGIAIGPSGGQADAPDDVCADAARQIDAYFSNRLRRFDLPLAPAATAFQARVRAAMLNIPFGETASYGRLAAALGTAPRAVGLACARNPLPIVVPCHRVLGAAGLGGYSGGAGPDTKRRLLALEAGCGPASRNPDLTTAVAGA
jgi:methylated-DNA-[protein]-cysteine S-methyltransferase